MTSESASEMAWETFDVVRRFRVHSGIDFSHFNRILSKLELSSAAVDSSQSSSGTCQGNSNERRCVEIVPLATTGVPTTTTITKPQVRSTRRNLNPTTAAKTSVGQSTATDQKVWTAAQTSVSSQSHKDAPCKSKDISLLHLLTTYRVSIYRTQIQPRQKSKDRV